MDVPGQRTRLHGNMTEAETEEASWFAMEVIPSESLRAQGDCLFPVRFTEIHLPHGAIVSGPTGQLAVDEGKYQIFYPDSYASETSWIVIFRDESMAIQGNALHPRASNKGSSIQPAPYKSLGDTGHHPNDISSENNIFSHGDKVDEAYPNQYSPASYEMADGNEGFFDEAMAAITTSMAEDVMPETPGRMVEAVGMNSTPEQQDTGGFQNQEYACQKFSNIFSAAITPETEPEQLRQAALNNEQLQNYLEFQKANPARTKLPSLGDSWVHPQMLHLQDSVGTKVMGSIDGLQKQGFLTIRLPTFYRVYPTRGLLTSFDLPFYDGTEQAGGGVYSFYLPTSPPASYDLPYLHPAVMATFDLPTNHRIWRDGEFIPNTLIKGPHEVMYVDGDIEIFDCHDSRCLLKSACGHGKAPAPLDIRNGGVGSDNNPDSGDSIERSPEDRNAQVPDDACDESTDTTDGEWDYLRKHMRPPQHRRAVRVAAEELLMPHRDWLYNEAKREKKAEEQENKGEPEEAKEKRKKVEKEKTKRESELYRQAAYREKTRQKRERDKWAQQRREADERELAAMMQQQQAASRGTQTRRPQRRSARAAVDYREKVAIQSSSSEDDSNKGESGSTDSSEDGEI